MKVKRASCGSFVAPAPRAGRAAVMPGVWRRSGGARWVRDRPSSGSLERGVQNAFHSALEDRKSHFR